MQGLIRGTLAVFMIPGALWAGLALGYFPPWPGWARWPLVLLWSLGNAWAWRRLPRRRATAATLAGILAVLMLWTRVRPAAQREWTPDLARMPRSRISSDEVEIRDLRHATYRSATDFDVHWYDRRFRLDDLESVDFVVEPFASWRGPAHTFLTFGFRGGEHVALSVETRREPGEDYSPLGGLFRLYELAYVAGDERDLIGLRANLRAHPVHLYPVRATKAQVRALFLGMLRRANRLAEAPEFYNTLTNTCTTNITRHLAELTGERLPFDLRVILPGYADALAQELGLIDAEGSLEEIRERSRINGRTAFGADGPGWSRQIRGAPAD